MARRLVEVFSAGCPLCNETINLVKGLACENCEIQVYDLREGCATSECLEKATQYGINRVPAVVIDGQLAGCCQNQQSVSREALVAAGIGQG
ncbi:thioredoxin family protein [Chroococcidiopsis sp. CCMEE 29]|uniref:thioredoxin family protein n=1 Tax=Chroococcidiopsis sp. CCMEE 29 TaxID=155894 RepID=UPI0020225616|nr:thioredoxin family protein [Chroococcidiopsis sp. CCMEE 29]